MIKKYIPIIIILALIVLIALGGYFVWWPKYQEFSAKKKEIETKDEEIKRREEYLAKINSLSEELLNFEREVLKIKTALPSKISVAALFNFLERTGLENGLMMEETNIGEIYEIEKTEDNVQKMPLEISFTGSYPSFKNFLFSVYQSSRLIEVKSINFNYPLQEDSRLLVFKLELQSHFYTN